MRNAETILGIIRERGRRGLPLERVYRLLFRRELFLLAYGRLCRNAGALTPGVTGETVDGMSLAKIDAIIAALRCERYRWTPARRVSIEKWEAFCKPTRTVDSEGVGRLVYAKKGCEFGRSE